MQYALFPLRHTWITQGMNGSYSHLETKAVDFGSLSAYKDYDLYAPFDGVVVWADSIAKGGAIAYQSSGKVKYADGSEDYMTVITAHDNTRPKAGQTFKQGEIYSHMGTAGNVGKHCHLEVQRGKFQKYTTYTSQGYYKFPNTIEPYKALTLTRDTYIKNESSIVVYPWEWLPEPQNPVLRDESKKQVLILAESLNVRLGHSVDAQSIGKAEVGKYYNVSGMDDDGEYVWYQIGDGQWIANDKQRKWVEEMPTKEEYDALLKKYEKVQKDLDDMTKLKEKYQKANAKKLKQLNQIKEVLNG